MGLFTVARFHTTTKIFNRTICVCGNLRAKKAKKTQSKSTQKKEEEPLRLGRFGTSLKVGIVGVPNIGKSTFFNALTSSKAAADNYPFSTIDPNEGRVPLPDERLDYLCDLYKPINKVPAFLKVVDIAGLIEGSSEGAGLGNAFLSQLSGCDAIFHLIRAFDKVEVTHVNGKVDPIRDGEAILNELRIKDVEYFNNRLKQLENMVKHKQDDELLEELNTVTKVLHCLEVEKKHLRFLKEWTSFDVEVLNRHLPLTAKPMLYLVNLSHHDYVCWKTNGNNNNNNNTGLDWLREITCWVSENDPEGRVLPFSGIYETKLLQKIDEDGHGAETDVHVESAFPSIIKSGFSSLQLQNFFTAGEKEVKAWTIQYGTKAPQAAGKIHTDFEKGFIIAEVMKYEDMKVFKSESALRTAGKCHQKGRNYVVNDGDLIHFKFNVAKKTINVAKKTKSKK